MKKLTISLTILLGSYAANSFAALPTDNASNCNVSAPSFCGGFTFGLTALYWRSKTNYLDYALTTPSFTNGSFSQLQHDYDWGWQANIGYIFPCSSNDVNIIYTDWDNTHHGHPDAFDAIFSTISAPFFAGDKLPVVVPSSIFNFTIGAPQILALTGLLFIPDFEVFLDPEDITDISARSQFQNNTWDLNFGQSINLGCHFNLHWFGGLRYTQLKHRLDTTIQFSSAETIAFNPRNIFVVSNPPDTVSATIATVTPVLNVDVSLRDEAFQKSNFNGVGPEFGIDAAYRFSHSFGIIGQILTSLLVGATESTYTERMIATITSSLDKDLTEVVIDMSPVPLRVDVISVDPAFITTVVPVANFSFRHPDETRVVPNIDAKLGLEWSYRFCNRSRSQMTIEAGYRVSHYFNALDRLSGIELFAPEVDSRKTLDVSFEGPYVGIQITF